MAMAPQEDNPVMLSAAKHLSAQRDRPFAAAQGDKKEPSHATTCTLCSSVQTPSPSGILDLCLRLVSIDTQCGYTCNSIQVFGDALCPVFDGFPIAEVAFVSPNRFYHHPFGERQFAVVDGSKENSLIAESDYLPELSYLLGLLLCVVDIGSERAAAEHPYRAPG